jgi:hypothetical protein
MIVPSGIPKPVSAIWRKSNTLDYSNAAERSNPLPHPQFDRISPRSRGQHDHQVKDHTALNLHVQQECIRVLATSQRRAFVEQTSSYYLYRAKVIPVAFR